VLVETVIRKGWQVRRTHRNLKDRIVYSGSTALPRGSMVPQAAIAFRHQG
jgi:hypothetical protein